jgi:iron complex transport system ATP-binding protein
MTLLETTELSVRLDNKTILDHIHFNLQQGELVALIGPNGSGKTTLLKTLIGLLPSVRGEIKILDVPLHSIKANYLARNIAYLPQGNESHWSVTVQSLVMLGRLPHQKPWQNPNDQDLEIVEKALRACDALQFRDRPVDHLSGGEKARVMLARALAVEPKILLADEPVAGLDPGHQLEVMERFQKLSGSGMGIVTVIHDLTLAARYCHRLVLLCDQKILAEGSPENVLSKENLSRSFNIQVHIGKIDGLAFVIPTTTSHFNQE